MQHRILLTFLLTGGLCFTATTSRAESKPSASPLRTVAGLTEPFLDVTLSSQVSGILRVEKFKEGDLVNQGDLILELDKRLEELEACRRKEVMERQKADMESTQTLFKTSKAVSRDEMDKRETEFKVAEADHEIAVEQLNRRQVKAPFAGSIADLFLHSGAACEPYQPLVRLVDIQRCYFVGYIDGVAVSQLKHNQAVRVDVDGAEAPVTAKISFISPVVDPASGLAKVKALFDNPQGKIRPGVAARMHWDSQ